MGSAPSRRRSTAALAGASVLVAVSNFAVMLTGSAALPTAAAKAEFLAFWSFASGLWGIVVGVQNETTRAVSAAAERGAHGVRALWPAVLAAAGVGAAALLVGPVLAPSMLPATGVAAVLVAVASVVAYGGLSALIGSLNGHARWTGSALAVGAEAVLRVVGVLAVALTTRSLLGMEIGASLGVLALPLVLLVLPVAREAIGSRVDAGLRTALGRVLLAMGSTACMALLINGYPAVMTVTHPGADAAVLGALILAVALTRAPIMMPMTTFQGVAIKLFMARRDRPLAALWSVARWLLLLAGVGAVAAWFVGPWFLPLIDRSYVLPAWVYASLTFSSAVMAVLTLLGTVALALGRHGLYVAGWVVGSAVAVGCLLLPLGLVEAVALSLFAGPLAGALVILASLRGTRATVTD